MVDQKKIETGILGLDDLLGGGISEGSGLLLTGDHGSGKTIILAEFLYRGLTRYNQNGVFVSFEHDPKSIVDDLTTFGWDIEKEIKHKRLAFVDASPSPDCEEIGVCYSMTPLLARINFGIAQNGARRVALDGLSSLFQKFGDKKMIYETVVATALELKKSGITYIVSSEKMPELAKFSKVPEVFDTVVELVQRTAVNDQIEREIKLVKEDGVFLSTGKSAKFDLNDEGVVVDFQTDVLRSS